MRGRIHANNDMKRFGRAQADSLDHIGREPGEPPIERGFGSPSPNERGEGTVLSMRRVQWRQPGVR